MNTIASPIHALQAESAMNVQSFVIPRQMLMWRAARLMEENNCISAPVVNEEGRCVGMLSPNDVLRWIASGCPEFPVDPDHLCRFQIRGRLLNGDIAEMCTLFDASCPFQGIQPTTAGRHTKVCLRTERFASPFGDLPTFMTASAPAVHPKTPLLDVVQKMVDSGVERLAVVDEREFPIGVISAWDALAALRRAGDCGVGELETDEDDRSRPSRRAGAGKPAHRPK